MSVAWDDEAGFRDRRSGSEDWVFSSMLAFAWASVRAGAKEWLLDEFSSSSSSAEVESLSSSSRLSSSSSRLFSRFTRSRFAWIEVLRVWR